MRPVAGPEFMVFPITYKCNSRCIMCTIWHQNERNELSLKEIKKLLSEPLLNFYLRRVSLTGGETTLRDDLPEIVDIILKRCQRLYDIAIVTNGIDTPRVIHQIKSIFPIVAKRGIKLNVLVSLDGVKEVHNTIRGIADSFDKTTGTFSELQKLYGGNPSVNLDASATISSKNCDSLEELYQYSQSHNIRLTLTPAIITEVYTTSQHIQDQFILSNNQRQKVIQFFKRLLISEGVGYGYFRFVTRWLKDGKRIASCPFQRCGFLLDVDGSIYPCGNFRDFYMGNIRSESFTEIWTGEKVNRVRRNMVKRCRHCGTNCYVEPSRISSFIPGRIKDFIKKNHVFLLKGNHGKV